MKSSTISFKPLQEDDLAYSEASGSLIPSDVDHYSEVSGSVIPNDVDHF